MLYLMLLSFLIALSFVSSLCGYVFSVTFLTTVFFHFLIALFWRCCYCFSYYCCCHGCYLKYDVCCTMKLHLNIPREYYPSINITSTICVIRTNKVFFRYTYAFCRLLWFNTTNELHLICLLPLHRHIMYIVLV